MEDSSFIIRIEQAEIPACEAKAIDGRLYVPLCGVVTWLEDGPGAWQEGMKLYLEFVGRFPDCWATDVATYLRERGCLHPEPALREYLERQGRIQVTEDDEGTRRLRVGGQP